MHQYKQASKPNSVQKKLLFHYDEVSDYEPSMIDSTASTKCDSEMHSEEHFPIDKILLKNKAPLKTQSEIRKRCYQQRLWDSNHHQYIKKLERGAKIAAPEKKKKRMLKQLVKESLAGEDQRKLKTFKEYTQIQRDKQCQQQLDQSEEDEDDEIYEKSIWNCLQ